MKKFLFIVLFLLSSCSIQNIEQKNINETKKTIEEINNIETIEDTNNIETNEDSFIINENQTEEYPITTREWTEEINEDILNEVMPEYKNIIYSKSDFILYDDAKINISYNTLKNKISNDYMSDEEKNISQLNMQTLEYFLQYETNLKKNIYDKLDETDYNEYLKTTDNNYGFNINTGTTNLSIAIDLTTMVIKNIYYEFDAIIYKPIKIPKEIVKKLEVEDKININYPHIKNGEVVMEDTFFEYDGGLGFIYKNNIDDDNFIEVELKSLDDNYYSFYENENRVDVEDKKCKIRILKNSNIGFGTNFKQIAKHETNYWLGLEEERHIYKDFEVFDTYDENKKDNVLFGDDKYFSANYIIFDKKGYITNLYQFGE